MKTLKFLEKINLVSPVKIQIGVEMNPDDKITFRPRNTGIPHPLACPADLHQVHETGLQDDMEAPPEPDVRKELPSKEDQGMFEELLVQQRDALKRTIEDLGAVITAYKARIAEHEEMIQEAKRKLEHIEGLIE